MANRHYHFKFNVDKDATYIQRLDAQENMQGYIRRLILSDIAADQLKDMFLMSDQVSDPEPDPDEMREIERQDFYAKYCPAIGNPEAHCKGCYFWNTSRSDDDCEIELAFKLYYAYKHGDTHADMLGFPK